LWAVILLGWLQAGSRCPAWQAVCPVSMHLGLLPECSAASRIAPASLAAHPALHKQKETPSVQLITGGIKAARSLMLEKMPLAGNDPI